MGYVIKCNEQLVPRLRDLLHPRPGRRWSNLRCAPGGTLSWRFDGRAGTMDACVDDGEMRRVFEGAIADEVYCGVFLDDAGEVKLESFRRVDVAPPLPPPPPPPPLVIPVPALDVCIVLALAIVSRMTCFSIRWWPARRRQQLRCAVHLGAHVCVGAVAFEGGECSRLCCLRGVPYFLLRVRRRPHCRGKLPGPRLLRSEPGWPGLRAHSLLRRAWRVNPTNARVHWRSACGCSRYARGMRSLPPGCVTRSLCLQTSASSARVDLDASCRQALVRLCPLAHAHPDTHAGRAQILAAQRDELLASIAGYSAFERGIDIPRGDLTPDLAAGGLAAALRSDSPADALRAAGVHVLGSGAYGVVVEGALRVRRVVAGAPLEATLRCAVKTVWHVLASEFNAAAFLREVGGEYKYKCKVSGTCDTGA